MSIQATPEIAADDSRWSKIVGEVNAWRGACMHCFTQAEEAVTETLLHLSAIAADARVVRLRHLVGQRFEDLAQAIAPGAAFATKGDAASEALSAFRLHEELRTLLGHDVARIAIEQNGKWIVLYRHLSIRARAAVRSRRAFEQKEAEELLSDLKRKTQKLCATLNELRSTTHAAAK